MESKVYWSGLCRRKWQPTPVFLPRESHGQRSLVGCHLWGRTESDMTEATWQKQQQLRNQWREMKKTKEIVLVRSFDVKGREKMRRLLEEGSKIKR